MRSTSRVIAAVALVVAGVLAWAEPAAADPGDLGTASCFRSAQSTDPACVQVGGLGGVGTFAVSPDGTSLYVTGFTSNTVTWFDRNPTSGALTYRGCVVAAKFSTECSATQLPMRGPRQVAVSPDGSSVYIASTVGSSVVAFRRAGSGALSPQACFVDQGVASPNCVSVEGLRGARSVEISANSRSVYVLGYDDDAVVRFDRATATGVLTPRGCVSSNPAALACSRLADSLDRPVDLALSADGTSLYAARLASGVWHLRRSSNGALTPDRCYALAGAGRDCGDFSLAGTRDIELSRNGASMYIVVNGTVGKLVIVNRAANGALSLAGCLSVAAPGCTPTATMQQPVSVAISPDGRSVYAGVLAAVVVLDRVAASGALTVDSCIRPPTSPSASCQPTPGMAGYSNLAVSPDGRSVFVAHVDSFASVRRNLS